MRKHDKNSLAEINTFEGYDNTNKPLFSNISINQV